MRSVREFATFVGKASDEVSVQGLSWHLYLEEAGSLRAMIEQFENLPVPFDFSIAVTPSGGRAPLQVLVEYADFRGIRIKGFPGVGGFRLLKDGQVVRAINSESGFHHLFDQGGHYVVEGTDEGVGRDGYAKVVRTVPVDVSAPTQPPPPPLGPPVIDVTKAGSGTSSAFTVTGSSFRPSHAVHVRVAYDDVSSFILHDTSSPSGTVSIAVNHACPLPGISVYFSVNDERDNPHDVTGTLWSNTVKKNCN